MALVAAAVAGCGGDGEHQHEPAGVWDEAGPGLGRGKADGTTYPAYAPLPAAADLEAPLSALFAPDDPVITLEVALIDRIRAARRRDAARYEDGANPFRIRYAVYNLRNPDVVEHLALAAGEGVDVQILMEADQLLPERHWNTADETLIGRGFEYAPDHRALDEHGRRTADLIGIKASGLMHLKTRLYEAPGFAAALSGSMNPGDEAVANEETLHLVRDPRLVEAYARAYDAVLRGRPIANAWDDAAAVNVLFTPEASGPRAGRRLLEWLASEQEQILLMVFSLRDLVADGVDRSLVQILGDKARAGVPVWVITDRKQSDGVDVDGQRIAADDGTEDRLRAAGVRVYEAINAATPYTAMHHKVAVLGRSRLRVVTDAANWTLAGLGGRGRRAANVESLLFIDSDRLDAGRTGRRYLGQWMRVLERYAPGSAARDGEPTFAEALATLTATPEWPRAPLLFEVRDVHTSWGEDARVVGDRAELGGWRPEAGHALVTGPLEYPTWRSPAPLSLPVGVRFEWKLVAGAARWERGDNRLDVLVPPPLEGDAPRVLRAAWR